jgi:pyridoxamine 5'-phosphate oxidase
MLTEALQRFRELTERAQTTSLAEPLAVTLATVSADGQPTARVVLLREFDERGFVFYTNSRSTKGSQIEANPRVALCFFWDELHEQVRVEGVASRVSGEMADAYWAKRPRESRVGAWASVQSETLDDRSTLVDRMTEYEAKFSGQEVPRPEHWNGYRVAPHRIEFWTRGSARLHERVSYDLSDGTWTKRLLYP